MKVTEPRREGRSDRERELAFRERQARRQAPTHHEAAARETAAREATAREGTAREATAREATHRRPEPPPVARLAEPRQPRARREGPRRSLILIPFLILISLGAAAAATVAVVSEPRSANLQSRVDSLSAELTRTQQQLAALRAQAGSSASVTNVKQIARSLRGLQRSLGGVQNTLVPLRAELNGLKICLPQLQQELQGVAAYKGKKGTTTLGLSPSCSGLLGAG